MRITYFYNSDLEEADSDDLLDLMIELMFLILVVCSVLGAFLSILTTGMIPFEGASISIFLSIVLLIYLITLD